MSHSKQTPLKTKIVSALCAVAALVFGVVVIKLFGQTLTPSLAAADTQQAAIKTSEKDAFAIALPIHPSVEIPTVTIKLKKEAPAPAEPVAAEPAAETVTQMASVAVVDYSATGGYPTVLSNGNTAGAIGREAAARMAAATGVPQATWEYIIARESNGDPNVANPSGASGLFQTMPGWGSTATVDDQINAALNAYNSQGLSAWAVQ